MVNRQMRAMCVPAIGQFLINLERGYRIAESRVSPISFDLCMSA